jgi:DNA gyrase subunit A
VPNLLINGAEGIGVGMVTSIPTHNLGECIDGVIAYMKNPDITTEEMMQYIPGPDFPTGGIVANKDELPEIYKTGIGKIKIRGKVEVEQLKGGRERLVITEIPYTMIGANIGKFLNDIYSLVETKKTNDIVDITNQSSKEGIRIVLELRKGADVEALKNLLYKKTKLEDTFGVNMLAVADGRPETLGLVEIIRHHVNFQYEIATRKYKTLLAKEQDKKEIQEGLIEACNVIDLIIEILRGSKNVSDAKACLTKGETANITFKSKESERQAKKLSFTERQASAILEMRLYRLIGLEIDALMKEHEETLAKIALYSDLLSSRSSMAKAIIKELKNFKKEYGTGRKTQIDNLAEAVVVEKAIEEKDVMFLMDRFGYAKTIDVSLYERNRETADAENRYVFSVKNTGRICIFTDKGQMHWVKVMDIPFGKLKDKGTPIDNISKYDSKSEHFIYVCAMEPLEGTKLIFGTKTAMLKIVDGSEFIVAKKTTAATKLADGDEVLLVGRVESSDTIVMRSKKDVFLRISCDQIPEKKKGAVGVRGMKLDKDDELSDIYYLKDGDSENVEVKGKEVALNRLHIGNRDTKGVKR